MHYQSTSLLEESTLWREPYLVRMAVLPCHTNSAPVARQTSKALRTAQSPSALYTSRTTQRTGALPRATDVGYHQVLCTALQHECGPSSCAVSEDAVVVTRIPGLWLPLKGRITEVDHTHVASKKDLPPLPKSQKLQWVVYRIKLARTPLCKGKARKH